MILRLGAVFAGALALALPAAGAPPGRLASHLFLPAGAAHSLAGLGTLVETLHLTRPPAVAVEGETLRALRGGISCLRFRYRADRDENGVQTLCAVVFDETGSCAGETRLRLDLERFAARKRGNADLLEPGRGVFFTACRTAAGRYRLQRGGRALPPLFLTMVDALGDGAYSLGDRELARQRASGIATYAGRTLRPPWIIQLGQEIERLELTSGASLAYALDDCGKTPACSASAELVRAGDVVRIGFGFREEPFEAALERAPEAVRDRFFRPRLAIGWDELAAADRSARTVAFARLAALEIMDRLLRRFDRLYGLRRQRVVIAYGANWLSQDEVTHLCHPDPAEQERCRRIEEALQAVEARRVAAWRDAGFRLWYGGSLDYREGGEPVRFAQLRPRVSLFEGVVAGVAANGSVRVPDVPAVLRAAVRRLAEDTALLPVVLYLSGPPITASTGGGFCEAEICPSDFRGAYEQAEAVLDEALAALGPQRLRGLGVALFEGSQFDLRRPYERFASFSLNRVGETGFNSPVLNAYRAR